MSIFSSLRQRLIGFLSDATQPVATLSPTGTLAVSVNPNVPAPLECLSKTTGPVAPSSGTGGFGFVRSLISDGVEFHGNVRVKDGIKIEGFVNGNVEVASGVLWIDGGGAVTGDIVADTAFINGRVDGTVRCRQILVGPSGRINGRVEYVDMHWNQGAVIRGELAQIESSAADPVVVPTVVAKPIRNIETVRPAPVVREIPRESAPENIVPLASVKA